MCHSIILPSFKSLSLLLSLLLLLLLLLFSLSSSLLSEAFLCLLLLAVVLLFSIYWLFKIASFIYLFYYFSACSDLLLFLVFVMLQYHNIINITASIVIFINFLISFFFLIFIFFGFVFFPFTSD